MKPDFICIGAVKSGTTWLHHNLQAHPGAWLPPIKELRYFDAPETNLWGRLTDGQRYDYWQMQARRFLRDRRAWLDPAYAWWHLRYFLGPRSPRWYASLFRPAGGRRAGEVTPLYAPMPESCIRFVREHFPWLKIIYLLRDPIDRAWSHILLRCMSLPDVSWDPGKLTEDVVRKTVYARDLDDAWLWTNGRYIENLRRWEAHFDADQIFIGFYEDIKERPRKLLTRVAAFLGIRPPSFADAAPVERRFNRKPAALDLPPEFEHLFAENYLDELNRMAQRFGAPADGWLRRARQACSR